MKALRFFFLSLLAAFAFAASAQTIEVYKDGRVIDSFSATQVDSVVYKSAAAQPRYYYYAGWDCPKTVEELENRGTEIENFEAMIVNSQIAVFDGTFINPNNTYDYYSLVVNDRMAIFDGEGSTRLDLDNSVFTHTKLGESDYTVYTSNLKAKRIGGIIIKKIR